MRFISWMKIISKMYHPHNIYSTFTVTWQGVAAVTVRAHTEAAAHVHSQAAPSPDLARQYFPYMFVVGLLSIRLYVIGHGS